MLETKDESSINKRHQITTIIVLVIFAVVLVIFVVVIIEVEAAVTPFFKLALRAVHKLVLNPS